MPNGELSFLGSGLSPTGTTSSLPIEDAGPLSSLTGFRAASPETTLVEELLAKYQAKPPQPPPPLSKPRLIAGALGDALQAYAAVRAGGQAPPVGGFAASVMARQKQYEDRAARFEEQRQDALESLLKIQEHANARQDRLDRQNIQALATPIRFFGTREVPAPGGIGPPATRQTLTTIPLTQAGVQGEPFVQDLPEGIVPESAQRIDISLGGLVERQRAGERGEESLQLRQRAQDFLQFDRTRNFTLRQEGEARLREQFERTKVIQDRLDPSTTDDLAKLMNTADVAQRTLDLFFQLGKPGTSIFTSLVPQRFRDRATKQFAAELTKAVTAMRRDIAGTALTATERELNQALFAELGQSITAGDAESIEFSLRAIASFALDLREAKIRGLEATGRNVSGFSEPVPVVGPDGKLRIP